MKTSTLERIENTSRTVGSSIEGMVGSLASYNQKKKDHELSMEYLKEQERQYYEKEKIRQNQLLREHNEKLDAELYKSSASILSEGLNNLLYSTKTNSGQTHLGYFEELLNGTDVNSFQSNWDNKYNEVFNAEYLASVFPVSQEHAQQFIDEFGYRYKTDGDLAVQGKIQESLMAQISANMDNLIEKLATNTDSLEEAFEEYTKEYEDRGGRETFDIFGLKDPNNPLIRTQFLTLYAQTQYKRYVEDNVTKAGFSITETMNLFSSEFDKLWDEINDGNPLLEQSKSTIKDKLMDEANSYVKNQLAEANTDSKYRLSDVSQWIAIRQFNGEEISGKELEARFLNSGDPNNAFDLMNYFDIFEQAKAYNDGLEKAKTSESYSFLNSMIFDYNNYTDKEIRQEIDYAVAHSLISPDEKDSLENSLKNRNSPAHRKVEELRKIASNLIDSIATGTERNQLKYLIDGNPSFTDNAEKYILSLGDKLADFDEEKMQAFVEPQINLLIQSNVNDNVLKAFDYKYNHFSATNEVVFDEDTIKDLIYKDENNELFFLRDDNLIDFGKRALPTFVSTNDKEKEFRNRLAIEKFGVDKFDDLSDFQKNYISVNMALIENDVASVTSLKSLVDELSDLNIVGLDDFKEISIDGTRTGILLKNGVVLFSDLNSSNRTFITSIDISSDTYKNVWNNRNNQIFKNELNITEVYNEDGTKNIKFDAFDSGTYKEQTEIYKKYKQFASEGMAGGVEQKERHLVVNEEYNASKNILAGMIINASRKARGIK